jgi:hypothetical protein
MPKDEGSVLLYAVDLDELRAWVGCGDERRFREALEAIGDDEESGWGGELRPTLECLLRRIVIEGALYPDLPESDRYYLTQVVIDLFDEYVDAEPVSDELSVARLLREAESLPPGEAATALRRLLRGRELNGDGLIWTAGPPERARPYLGYVRRDEAGGAATGLEAALKRAKGRPSGVWRPVLAGLRECAETGYDLVSLVG